MERRPCRAKRVAKEEKKWYSVRKAAASRRVKGGRRMDHREKAMELFEEGYNCAQAVAGAFCEEMEMCIRDRA